MKPEDLPHRWKAKVREYLRSQHVHDRDELNAYDFFVDQVALIKCDDGSTARFMCPLVIEAPELGEICVFTEHCGHHIFSMAGTHVCMEDDELS